MVEGVRWWLGGRESAWHCRFGFDPWSRRIPHAMEQLSLCTRTIESVFWSLGAATIEVHVP